MSEHSEVMAAVCERKRETDPIDVVLGFFDKPEDREPVALWGRFFDMTDEGAQYAARAITDFDSGGFDTL